jgi:hypothetical protein
MISKRLQFLKDADLRGELLEVVNKWSDDCASDTAWMVGEQDRLELVDALFNFLTRYHK